MCVDYSISLALQIKDLAFRIVPSALGKKDGMSNIRKGCAILYRLSYGVNVVSLQRAPIFRDRPLELSCDPRFASF